MTEATSLRSFCDGLSALADALETVTPKVECYLLGGEGARRAFALAGSAGLRCAAERGADAVSAALGAVARGAHPWLFASGESTVLLAGALRACARLGGALVGVVPSHGDDVGDSLPLSDGTDLSPLSSAPCECWIASCADEVDALVYACASRAADGASAVLAFDLRGVGLARVAASSGARPRASVAPVLVAPHGVSDVLLVSSGSGREARRAAEWLRSEGVAAGALSVSLRKPLSLEALRSSLESASLIAVHEMGAGDAVTSREGASLGAVGALVRALSPERARVVRVASDGFADAALFCEAVGVAEHRRAAREAGSRALRVQLAGAPSTRGPAVADALSVLADAGIDARCECVSPTHALFTVDVGPARSIGSPGWALTVAGLPVQSPLDPSLGEGAMLVDAGAGSTLTCGEGASDEAALVVSVVFAELTLRAPEALRAPLARAVDRRASAGPSSARAWAEVRARAAHLLSLR
jgi:hypothetical protein